MPKTEAKTRTDAAWNKKTYDRVLVVLRKDDEINGDFIRTYAKSRGESVNGFLKRAVTEMIERDKTR